MTRRCAADSLARGDPQFATASVVRAFLLVEFPGAWGRTALRDARLPSGIGAHLARESARQGIKTLLIRRHGRTAEPLRPRVFAAYAHPDLPWMETGSLSSLEELLDVDLASLGQGRSVGFTPTDQSIFCVCTHGRHDACCAELGRPVAAALARELPASVWEVSHIGGDRFAANVVVLPHGLYYGRVAPDRVGDLVRRHLEGHLTLDLLRGRSSYPFVVQAGEYFLRRELAETHIDGVRLVGRSLLEGPPGTAASWHLDFAVESGTWTVRVRASKSPPSLLTCRSQTASPFPMFTLRGIDPSEEAVTRLRGREM